MLLILSSMEIEAVTLMSADTDSFSRGYCINTKAFLLLSTSISFCLQIFLPETLVTHSVTQFFFPVPVTSKHNTRQKVSALEPGSFSSTLDCVELWAQLTC